MRAESRKIAHDIIVTAGDISQPYPILGEVKYDTLGSINLGSAFNDLLFRSPFAVAASGRTPDLSPDLMPELMNERLKQVAKEKYGSRVDAVINATYQARSDGETFGSGIAVEVVETPLHRVSLAE